ncbi:MAG: DUF5915 domain-containing protein, partial [Candidatus Anstonellales archaeon]
NLRNKLNVNVRQPLENAIFITFNEQIISLLNDTKSIISELTNVKDIKITNTLDEKIQLSLKPKTNEFGAVFKERNNEILNKLNHDLKAREKIIEIVKEIIDNGYYLIENNKINLNFFEQEITYPHHVGIITKYGVVLLNKQITKELQLEGFAREIIRRIQEMRKEMKLNQSDKIKFHLIDEELNEIKKLIQFIEEEVNGIFSEKSLDNCFEKKWEIKNKRITIQIKAIKDK